MGDGVGWVYVFILKKERNPSIHSKEALRQGCESWKEKSILGRLSGEVACDQPLKEW